MPTREELVAALSMGPGPQQQGTADPRWQRLMQELLAREEQKQAAFDPSLFAAGGQEMDLAQGVTDPNAKFQGGGASGSWQEPPSTLGEWWDQSTAFKPMAEEAVSAATLPGDVYAGRVDPASDEAIDRAAGLAGMVTLGAGAVPAKGAELGMGIRLFHGSPHDFAPEPGHPHGRFRWDKIGTGEGAQMYGYGHYGAEAEAVGLEYKKDLAGQISVDGQPILRNNQRVGSTGDPELDDELIAENGDVGKALAGMRTHLDELVASGSPQRSIERVQGMVSKLEGLSEPGRVQVGNTGKMYEFEVDADPEHFLDWDKPLSQQSETVQEGIRSQPWGEEYLKGDFFTGGHVTPRTPEGAAQLREAGIPGIRYLDQGSRDPTKMKELAADLEQYKQAAKHWAETGNSEKLATAQGQIAALEKRLAQTSNYVIFDDNLINILRKYGMAGMIGTPLGLEMAQRLMQQEQGETAPAL